MSDNLTSEILPANTEEPETISFRQQSLQVIRSIGHDNLGYAWLVRHMPSTAQPPEESEPNTPTTDTPEPTQETPPLILKSIVGLTPKDPASFEREFQTLARLDHPGLARFRQLEISPNSISYTRDYNEGLDFLSFLRRPLTERERHDLHIRLNDGDSAHLHTTDTDLELTTLTPTESQNTEPQTIEIDFSDLESLSSPSDPEIPSETSAENTLTDTTPNNDPAPLDLIFLRLEHILPQLLSALEYLHRFRTTHGNLKPTTIHIDANGTLFLSDYGLRRLLQPATESTEPTDSPIESPTEPADDLYALGCLLFDAIAPPTPTNQTRPAIQRESLLSLQPLCPTGWLELVQELLHPQATRRPDLQQIRRLIDNSIARSVALPPTQIDEQSTFFGRNDILSSLLELNKKTTASRSMHFALLTGPVGVGKIALLDLLAYRSAQSGWLVLRGACYQGDITLYQAFSEVAAQLAKIYKQLPENVQHKLAPTARQAARLFPCLSPDNLPLSPANPATPNAAPPCTTAARLFAIDALRQLLATIAEQRPLLICLDNLQHASADTIALLADLASQPQSLRCMIAASISNDLLANPKNPITTAFRNAPIQPQIISVPCFTRREARHYILGAARSLPLEKQKQILKNGQLHPLLIDELIFEQHHHLSTPQNLRNTPTTQLELELTTNPQSTTPQSTHTTETLPVTEQLKTLYKNRLATLSRTERLVLQLLTIASAPLSAELLTKVILTELGSQQFAGQSGALIAEKLVRLRLAHRQSTLLQPSSSNTTSIPENPENSEKPAPNTQKNANYLPPHDICRQIVLDDIGRDHRTHLCSLIVDSLTNDARSPSPGHATDLRFEYLMRAKRTNEAIDTAPAAAHSAEYRFSFQRAADIWRWHLENTSTKRIQSSDCLSHLARVEARAGNFEQAAIHYQSTATSLQESQEPTPENQIKRARAHLYEADAWLHAGNATNAVTALNYALTVFSERYTSNVLSGTITGLKVSLLATFGRSRKPAARLQETHIQAASAAELTRAEIYRFAIECNDFLHSARGRSMQNRLARLARNTHDTYLNALDRVWLVPELHVPAISYAPENQHADLTADLALSATLFEQTNNHRGLATVAYANALRSKRRALFDDATQHLQRATLQTARANFPETSQEYRIAYTHARLLLDQGNLEEAETIARQILHIHRNNHLATLRAHQILTDIFLLRGQIDQAAISLNHTSSNPAVLESSFVHIEIARQSARLNIAKGRPEVAAGHLDMLIDQLHTTRLANLAPARLLAELTLGQALAALLERQKILDEPRQTETSRRLAKAITQLHHQRKTPITTSLAAEITRLRALRELLRNRPLKALRELNDASTHITTINTSLETARHAEATAITSLRIEKLDRSDARTALESARSSYAQHGFNLPLILEGWPAPHTSNTTPEDHT